MEEMQFEEPQYAQSAAQREKHSWLSGIVIKTGLAKDDLGAQKVLLVVLILVVLATVFLLWRSSAPPPPSLPPGFPTGT